MVGFTQDPNQEAAAVLQARCWSCHGAEKAKGGLRLDTEEGLTSVLDREAWQESEFAYRIGLPSEDSDVMPPDGSLPAEELAVLQNWMKAGAETIGFFDQVKSAAENRRAEQQRLAELGRLCGGRVDFAAGADESWLAVDFSLNTATPSAEGLAALQTVADRIVEISLAKQQWPEAVWQVLPAMPKLRRVHFQASNAPPPWLQSWLPQSPELEYLNLHSTSVGSELSQLFPKLSRLQRLVLYQTKVSEAELEAWQRSWPDLQISGSLALPAEPFQHGSPRRLLAADASKKRIALIQETAIGHFELLWEHPIEQLHDLQWLADGRVLFQDRWTRILEIDPKDGSLHWSYDAAAQNRRPGDGPIEIHAFQRLADDVTLIAESGAARLLEVDRQGTLLWQIPLQVDRPDPHHDTRLVRKTPTGTYLVCHEADGVVREYDRQGRVLWFYEVPLFNRKPASGWGADAWGNQVFAAIRLPNGHTLLSTGNGHGVLEVNPDKQIVWQLRQDELPEIRLAWVTTLQVLKNGNIVIGNCHGEEAQPQILEIDRQKKIHWRFRDFERFGNSLSNGFILEDTQVLSGHSLR